MFIEITPSRDGFPKNTKMVTEKSQKGQYPAITGAQLRAARALLKWSGSETAKAAGITRKTLERLEQMDGVPVARPNTLRSLQRVLESAGVEFTGSPSESPGVRVARK